MRSQALVIVLAASGLGWAALSAQPPAAPVPGPGSGIVTVRGTVDIGNAPPVLASQAGEWKVAVSNVPEVRVISSAPLTLAPLEFVVAKGRYDVTWTAGDRETIEVVQLGPAAWVQVRSDEKRRRWVNLALARSVEAVP